MRVGFSVRDLASKMIPVDEMLVQEGYQLDEEASKAVLATKDDVYRQILRYLRIEGYPMESPDFKEGNVNDLALLIILPVIDDFMLRTGRDKVRLTREKQIVTDDLEMGGAEEFVVIDEVELGKERYLFIVEAKRSSLGAAMGQCLVSMKDIGDKNDGSIIYGFVTTGESWRMLKYHDGSFQVTDKMEVLFGMMSHNKEKWINQYSTVVDCINVALMNGG